MTSLVTVGNVVAFKQLMLKTDNVVILSLLAIVFSTRSSLYSYLQKEIVRSLSSTQLNSIFFMATRLPSLHLNVYATASFLIVLFLIFRSLLHSRGQNTNNKFFRFSDKRSSSSSPVNRAKAKNNCSSEFIWLCKNFEKCP